MFVSASLFNIIAFYLNVRYENLLDNSEHHPGNLCWTLRETSLYTSIVDRFMYLITVRLRFFLKGS